MVRKISMLVIVLLIVGIFLTSCDLLLSPSSSSGSQELESTRVAIAIQQTSMAMEQTRVALAEPPAAVPEAQIQPTYTPYPTYTSEAVVQPPPVEQPTVAVVEQPTVAEPEAALSFEDWLKDAKILLYDDMYGYWDPQPVVISHAIDSLGLGRNTTNVKDAMGFLLQHMNSATEWDLVIIAAERRDSVSGEYFDALATSLDRGSSVILEIWYLDEVHFGRIQPVLQRCGLAFHREWPRNNNSDWNDFLVYLLDPSHPVFNEPNSMSMLRPYGILWWGDAGDLLKVNPGSSAGVLLAGSQQKEFNSYGLISDCLDGRMIWQTFSTHDYRTEEMINLWQNYIYNTLQARYRYLYE